MTSRSYTNLQDLTLGDSTAQSGSKWKQMSRAMTVPGTPSKLDDEDPPGRSSSNATSTATHDRIIIVANELPVRANRRTGGCGWNFSWDKDSLLFQLKDGFPEDMEVFYVGSLHVNVDCHEEDGVAQSLLEHFKCIPTFLRRGLLQEFYRRFCKQQLWPLFHYMLPFSPDHGGLFDRALWNSYILANQKFARKVIEVLNPEDDYVWIHDYHLMVLPTLLRRKFHRLRMGFFLHSPFPSSEIYRTFPVREELLKGLLNCDLIGFHTFDYARHFLSCCGRMLGLEYQSKRGYLGLDFFGRTVGIKITPIGVHMGQLQSVLQLPNRDWMVDDHRRQVEGKTVLLGVDDMDIFKGINLKVLAFEKMLQLYPKWQGRAVLIQVANPSRGTGRDLDLMEGEIREICWRINEEFGNDEYEPVVLVDRPVPIVEKIAFYTMAECVVVTAVRDGMNLTPYEYIVCRQGIAGSEPGLDADGPRKSMLVVSEFIGCSPSLSGAIRVNPWDIESTAHAMNEAISLPDAEKRLRHEKHYRYVSTHDMAYWSRSFLQDMERFCKDHSEKSYWGIGFGLGFRVMGVDPNFKKLNVRDVASAYKVAKNRAILLDYDGTLVPQTSFNMTPSAEVIRIINSLCADKKNVVFIVSGRGRDSLGNWFSPCERLGIAAEHGYFMRWTRDQEWEICCQISDFRWMQIAEPVMKLYTESTDGSSIEAKESALVWRHRYADPGFGSAQAKEMLDHLESVLANEPVSVKRGEFIVEVKAQGVSKGSVAEKVLLSMVENGRPADFVLCVGDDRSDEDMFEDVAGVMTKNLVAPGTSLFACTVGQKPSKAKYYLDDTVEVLGMLAELARVSGSWRTEQPSASAEMRDDTSH
ncbi:probable alpha,alpha-trehalose-phosphate synthase [UDP-forming] 7 isoform X2 [Elaeis guineensis]